MAPRRGKKKTSARNGKNIDVLSSQYSQQQPNSKSSQSPLKNSFTPIRRTIAPNSLVQSNQSIFSPIKEKNDEIEIDEETKEYKSGSGSSDTSDGNSDDVDSNDDIIDVSDDDDESFKSSNEINSIKIKPLTKYTVPLNTKSWQPLLPQVHSELSILLKLLKPPTLKNGSTYDKALDSQIINPLIKNFSHVYLPPINKVNHRLPKQRTSSEFNLTILNQEQNRLSVGYDINSKQLDMLTLQLLKEKEMIRAEKKYLGELKENVKKWKSTKDKKLVRLKSSLGDEFQEISDLIDSNSNSTGADDINLVDSDWQDDGQDSDNEMDDIKISKRINYLNKYFSELEMNNAENKQFQAILRQLLDLLKDG